MGAVKFETDSTCASGQTILHSAGSLRALSYFPDCRVHVSWTRVFVSDYFSILSADRRQQAGRGTKVSLRMRKLSALITIHVCDHLMKAERDRKSTRLNSSHIAVSRMPS